MRFHKKQLQPTKRVCLRLREAREKAGLSIDELAKKLRMSAKYVVALEECKFEALPFSTLYQKKFISSYLKALGYDDATYVSQFMAEEGEPAPVLAEPTGRTTQLGHTLPMIFRVGSIALVVLLFVGYLLFQVRHLLAPPDLVIFTPEADFTTHEPTLRITGKTTAEAQLNINGNPVMNSTNGFFEEEITLADGVNTIMVTAQKKHSDPTTQVRHIILREDQVITAAPTDKVFQ